MTIVHFGALWVHLATCVLLTGATFLLLLAGPPPDAVTSRWEHRVLSACKWLSGTALASGVVWLAARTSVFEGRPEAALEPYALAKAMLDTWPGQIWMARHGLLIVLASFLLPFSDVTRFADWFAARSAAFLLSASALVLVGSSGHVAAISDTLWLQCLDMLHLLGGGIWIGALPPLAFLLYCANTGRTIPAPFSLRTIRRFSRIAIVAVVVIVGTGVVSSWLLIESVAGLIGTAHGRLLLAKIAFLIPALLLAAKVRRLLCVPRASCTQPTTVLIRRMAFYIAGEATLILILLGFAVAMALSVPAIHSDPIWPLPIRLSLNRFEDVSIARLPAQSSTAILLVLASLGLLAASRALRRRRLPFLAGGAACLTAAVIVAVPPPLIARAYPTSFVRPPVSYHVSSIAKGKAIYEQNCTSRFTWFFESEAARWLTAGELFWLVTNGLPAQGLAGCNNRLEEVDRWHVVNFMRAYIRASESRKIEPAVDFENPWLVAPDFTISVGPLTPSSLRDWRHRRMVLLVLYSLPESRERLSELALKYGALSVLGVEIVAVSRQTTGNPIAKLGDDPPISFPVVTSGNAEISTAYGLFAPGVSHAELLIDRQGYLRAIWREGETGMPDVEAVQAQVERLNQEKTPPPLPEDHIH